MELTSLRKLSIEFAIIVIGVLFAFWIDSNWEQSQQRGLRNEFLSAVLSELEVNSERIANGLNNYERISEFRERLLSISNSATEKTDSEITELVWFGTVGYRTNVINSSLSSFEQSPVWAGLDDTRLLVELSDLNRTLDQLRIRGEDSKNYYFNKVDPYLSARINYESWENRTSDPDVDWNQILEDQEFRNLIISMRWMGESIRSANLRAQDQIEQLKDHIYTYMNSH